MNAIILAGGKNSRIGTRKAFLEIEGRPIIQRTIDLLKPRFDRVYLVTNEPELYARFGLEMVADEIKEAGPLGGIHAGLGVTGSDYNFVVACDMPFLSGQLVDYLKERVEKSEDPVQCVVPRWYKGIEPLHAIYHRSLRPKISEALAAGERKMGFLVRNWQAYFIDLDEWAEANGVQLEKVFSNVNTWAEFEAAKKVSE
ncbi:MAG: molybdenum cofactor guanylyltransferase [Firmicutes bacterium]|nr:molybdenum cofactor guanylyltransferase [Bacillota bacterium]